ncbi:MAG: PAS domain S-box protein [Candidatus Hydrogenedentes bacterium]|nr:PAS domain S-box protein [Candidatus Hydrogenedentota bacterium]
MKKRSEKKKRPEDGKKSPAEAVPAVPDRCGAEASFPIVGIGASAGGLEAFTQLLKALPLDTGMAFVLVQHLDPVHESALTKILGRVTSLSVREVINNQRVQADHVYVIPPGTNLSIAQGVLMLEPRAGTRTPHRPLDTFFESLAMDQRECAIGVVLSGTASDGTLGLEAIKAEGGITFAQDDSAKYDSMPRSAIAAGCVDLVLSPVDIANELARIAKHPYIAGHSLEISIRPELDHAEAVEHQDDDAPLPSGGKGTPNTGAEQARDESTDSQGNGENTAQSKDADNGYKNILMHLRNHSGVDFSLYKSNTIQRRISRRLVLNKHDTLESYGKFLRNNAKELDSLYSDVLISVTSFFRNPETFDALQRDVFPALLQRRGDDPLRVWVLGCSTGQEAYSIAISFVESAEKAPRMRKLQIFATDLNDALLEKARHGLYAKSLAGDITPERLKRFFFEEEGGYRINKALREMVVFARQNLIADPPFSRLDLISCRNLLIYLEPGLQKKAMPTFHYALKPDGFLLLGASESIGGFTDLFETVDRKHKIFSKKQAPTPGFHLPVRRDQGDRERAVPSLPMRQRGQPEALDGVVRAELNAQREADRIAVNQFAPPGVLINDQLQVLQFRGPTGAYLEPPAGKASFDVLKMAREGLMLPLRAAINEARKDNKTAIAENVRVKRDGETRTILLEVIPLKNLPERCFLIVFKEAEEAIRGSGRAPLREEPARAVLSKKEETNRIAELESDLAETGEYLQSLQEQHEAANEELQAANEELQSINEELETSKEELESGNEELTTLNEEMIHRNLELNRLNNDLINLQTSVKIAIILLGRDLTIRRVSRQAHEQFGLITTDLGRPISHIQHNLPLHSASSANSAPDLDKLCAEVIASVREHECEVRDKAGRWHSLRVRPYITLDNKVDGAVLVLVDIDALKHSEQIASDARDFAQNTVDTVRDPMLVLDGQLHVESANRSFYRAFNVAPAEVIGKFIYDLGNGEWNIPRLRELLEEVLTRSSTIEDFEVDHEFAQLGHRIMLLNARRLYDSERNIQRILVAIEDITGRKQTEAALRESEERYRTLFDLGPVAVYSCDASGVIQNFNGRAAELWGRAPEQGNTDEKFCGSGKMFRPDGTFMPHDQCPMAQVLSGAIPHLTDGEVHIERPDGSRVVVIVAIRPLKNEHGEITGAINCFYDITERKQAEMVLRESDQRYRNLFNAIDEGFCVIEMMFDEHGKPVDYRFLETNPAFEKQSGLQDALGKRMRELRPHHEEHWFETYGKVALTGEAVRFEAEAAELGRSFDVYALRVGDPESRKVAVVFTDITERKRTEVDLERSAELLRFVMSSMPQKIFTAKANGDMDFFNSQWSEYTGVPFDQIRDWGWARFIHPDDEAENVRVWRHSIHTGEPFQFEHRIRRADGEYRWHVTRALSMRDEADGVSMWIGSNSDIHDIKQAEQALHDSEVRYRRLFETSKDGILILDADNGKIVDANAFMSAMVELEPEELVGKELYEIGMFKDIEENKEAFRELQRTGYLRHEHLPVHNQSGGQVEVEFIANVYQEDHTLVAQCNVRDISQRVEMERKIIRQAEALAEESRRKDEFLAMLSHELRNPLAPIRSAVHLLKLHAHGTENIIAQQAREIIERQAGNLTKLVSDLMEVSRVVSGRVRLNQQIVDMNQIVRHAIETSTPLIEQHKHALAVNCSSQPVWASVDATRMEEVLINLLNNAAKYTDDGGRIEITCEHDGQDYVQVRVRDNGVGIDGKLLPRIFDLFTQADRSLDRAAGGLGIGLSLAHRLVGMHGGSIEVQSPPSGMTSGSEFIVRLPQVPPPYALLEPSISDSGEAKSEGVRVLVVDDNIDQVTMIVSILRHQGYSVQSAHSGTDGLKVAKLWRPDLVLLDIGLPGLDGYEVARQLRSDPNTQGAKIIALTGYGRDTDIAREQEVGFDAHLTKPFEFDELEKLMRNSSPPGV